MGSVPGKPDATRATTWVVAKLSISSLTVLHLVISSGPGTEEELAASNKVSPLWGSNPRPYAYEAHALPAELRRLSC